MESQNLISPDSNDNQITTPQLSFGEQLVGLTFNPSNDDYVGRAKKIMRRISRFSL